MTWTEYLEDVAGDIAIAVDCGDADAWIDLDGVTDSAVDRVQSEAIMWDSVTGARSGSYTCDAAEAVKNTAGLAYDSMFRDACDDYGVDWKGFITDSAESDDVEARILAVRCIRPTIKDILWARRDSILEDARTASNYYDADVDAYIYACMRRLVPDLVEYADDGYSVRLTDSDAGLHVWIDVCVDGDIDVDWNMFMFDLTSRRDVWRRDFQNDTRAFEFCTDAAVDHLVSVGSIVQDPAGMWHRRTAVNCEALDCALDVAAEVMDADWAALRDSILSVDPVEVDGRVVGHEFTRTLGGPTVTINTAVGGVVYEWHDVREFVSLPSDVVARLDDDGPRELTPRY